MSDVGWTSPQNRNMRNRYSAIKWIPVIAAAVIGAAITLFLFPVLWEAQAGDHSLWRMRANIRKADTARPESPVRVMVDNYVGRALGEGPNGLENALRYEKELLALGRLSSRDFPLAIPADPAAYQSLWKELGDVAPGAHFSPQGIPGSITNLHAVAAVEDMPGLEKAVASFNSNGHQRNAQPAAPGDGNTGFFFHRERPNRAAPGKWRSH
jgi:hypothetical protein